MTVAVDPSAVRVQETLPVSEASSALLASERHLYLDVLKLSALPSWRFTSGCRESCIL